MHPSLILIGGPTGIGKTTVITHLLSIYPDLYTRPTSYTSRQQRPGEGNDEYLFSDKEEMLELFRRGDLLNLDLVYDHAYGISRRSAQEVLDRGLSALKEVHPQNQGAISVPPYSTTKVLLLPLNLSQHLSSTGPRNIDPERRDDDLAYYASIDLFDFDIIRWIPAEEDLKTIAEDLHRALAALAYSRGRYPPPGDIDRLNQKGYEKIAPEFVEAKRPTTSNFHLLSHDFFSSALQSLATDGMQVLELGPGRGWLRNSFRWPRVQYRSAELTSAMIGVDEKGPSTSFSSARALPYMSLSFDLVIASLADPYLYPTAIAEIYRVTRKGGHFALTCPHRTWSSAVRETFAEDQTIFKLASGLEVRTYSFTYDETELAELLEAGGFKVGRVDQIDGSRLQSLPEEEVSPFIREAASKLRILPSKLRILLGAVASRQ